MSTYGIHALKLTRPSTEPSARIGVISAWPCSPTWPRTLPPSPHIVPRNPCVPNTPEPLCAMGLPKPILKAHRHQAISVRQKATNVSIMLFTDQRFCITPPYRTARPGTLMSPTSVAAVICHALSPGLSQLGYACQVMCLRSCSCRLPPPPAHADEAHGLPWVMKS